MQIKKLEEAPGHLLLDRESHGSKAVDSLQSLITKTFRMADAAPADNREVG